MVLMILSTNKVYFKERKIKKMLNVMQENYILLH